MKFFKEMTCEDVVIMGRKTWDSLPDQYKPLPGRVNVIISRSHEFIKETYEKYKTENNKPKILMNINNLVSLYQRNKEVDIWCMGGKEIYNQLIDYASEIYVTKIYKKNEDYFLKGKDIVFSPEVPDEFEPFSGVSKQISFKFNEKYIFDDYDLEFMAFRKVSND